MTGTKHGFIVTYFKHNPSCEKLLIDLVSAISRENVYLILASHTSDVPIEIQKMCDFYFYEELNIVDNRKYSHGVAESSLIEIALNHLKLKNINWTFKCSYDVIIKDVSQFDLWVKNYEYDFVSCCWGPCFLATNSFFANVNFVLSNIKFYKTPEEMFAVNNVLENCWQHDIEIKNLKHRVFSFPSKRDFFGELNIIDTIGYDYCHLNFWYDEREKKFFCAYDGPDFEGSVRIFDYYSDLCLFSSKNFKHERGITMWFAPGPHNSNAIAHAKNGWYVEYEFDNYKLRANFGIKDFYWKDDLYKSYKTFKHTFEIKYGEYVDLSELEMYKKSTKCKIDFSKIKNYVDVGANFGLASSYFIKNKIKCYMVEPDSYNIDILRNAYSLQPNLKILPYAISNVNGLVDFYSQIDCTVVSSLYEEWAPGNGVNNRKKVQIESITPNTLIEKHIEESYVDLMKIDIEGAEYTFFETITDENLKKINNIIIEFHHNKNYEALKIIERLAKNDFTFKLDNWGDLVNPFVIENHMGIIYAWR